jgi:hypothetical protein
MNPEEKVTKALHRLLGAADEANEAAIVFNGEILSHRKDLISEATTVREAATLLTHLAQNAARTTLKALGAKGAAGKGGGR